MQNEQPAWANIEAESPDLVLLLGDNAYMRNSRWDHDGLEELQEPVPAEAGAMTGRPTNPEGQSLRPETNDWETRP